MRPRKDKAPRAPTFHAHFPHGSHGILIRPYGCPILKAGSPVGLPPHAAPAALAMGASAPTSVAERSSRPTSVAAASTMIGADGLKPLNTSQRPSVSSHRKIGTSAIADQAEYSLLMPTTCPSADEIMSGAPMRPNSGMTRGTRPDRYMSDPSRRALMPGRRVCPMRNVQSWIATRDRPVLTREVASAPAVAPTS